MLVLIFLACLLPTQTTTDDTNTRPPSMDGTASTSDPVTSPAN